MRIKRLLIKFRQWIRSTVVMLAAIGALTCLVMALSSLKGIPITVNPEWGSLTSYIVVAFGGIGIAAVMLECYFYLVGFVKGIGKHKTKPVADKKPESKLGKYRWYVLAGVVVAWLVWQYGS